MIFRNYTPHPVMICDGEGVVIRTIPSENTPIRLSQQTEIVGSADGIPLSRTAYGEPVGLPSQEEGTMLIVSQLVFSALQGKRTDLCVPADVVRDAAGNIIGCRSLGV